MIQPDKINSQRSWQGSNLVAFTTWNGRVRLFDALAKSYKSEFFTHKEPGGVSVALSAKDEYCFCGSYYAWGLACFEVASGKTIWFRKDLGRFYGLCFSQSRHSLFGYFDGKSAVEIDPVTGETKSSFRGVTEIAASWFDGLVLLRNKRFFTMTNEKRGKQWTAPTESFGVLDVAWSPDCVAISEVGEFNLPQQIKAGVRCFSRDGKLLWRYRAQNDHVGPLRFRPNKNSFVGIDFTSGTAFKLIELDSLTGQVIHEAALPEFGLPAFFGDGEGYLYADSATHGANVYSL